MLSLIYSGVFGFIGFWLGFSGPLTPPGNLGPLLGIFITGPAGILLGAIAGLIHSALYKDERNTKTEVLILTIILLICQFFLIFISSGFNLNLRIVPISIQIILVLTGYYLFVLKKSYSCTRLTKEFHRVFLVAGTLIIFSSLFPPVTRPWWAPEAWKERWTTQELPLVAYVFDRRFDASQRIPEFAIDRGRLVCETFAIIVITGVGGYIVAKRKRFSA